METLVLRLKGEASSICSKKEKELLIPVTYDSSVDGKEYGIIALNIASSIHASTEYAYANLLEITDKLGNYQFGMGSFEKGNNTFREFDPVNGIYKDKLTFEMLYLYGSFSTYIKIFFKKKKDSNNINGLIDIIPLVDIFQYIMLGQIGVGFFVSANSKSRGKEPLSLSAIPVLSSFTNSLYMKTLNCGLDEIQDIFPNAKSIHIEELTSYSIDKLADSNIEKLYLNRYDGDLVNLPIKLVSISDSYNEKGCLHYSGDKSAKFTQLNSVILHMSSLSLTQDEIDNFLGCLAASTWSGDNKQLCIKTGTGVTLNQESINIIKGKGVSILD